jgi:hypothetical protein
MLRACLLWSIKGLMGGHMNVIKACVKNISDEFNYKASCCLFVIHILMGVPGGYCFAAERVDIQAMTQYANDNLLKILNSIPG